MGAVLSILTLVAIAATIITSYFTFYIRGFIKAEYQKNNIAIASKCPLAVSAIDLSSKNCCFIGGRLTPFRYSSEIDMVLSPQPVYPLNVCEGFCVNGIDNNSPREAPNCLGVDGNNLFQQCMDRLIPKDCATAAIPIGYIANTYFYGYAAGASLCQTTRPCSTISLL